MSNHRVGAMTPTSLLRTWLTATVVVATAGAGIAYSTLRWLASVAEITADNLENFDD